MFLVIFAVYCDDHYSGVTSRSMSNMMYACEKTALPHEAHSLFKYVSLSCNIVFTAICAVFNFKYLIDQ